MCELHNYLTVYISLDIAEAPLIIYCHLEEKVYVKMPMNFQITLRNTSNTTLHLKSFLKNAENFMFSGNTQVKHEFDYILMIKKSNA